MRTPVWAALVFVAVLGSAGTTLALVWMSGSSCACAMAHPGLVLGETEAPEGTQGAGDRRAGQPQSGRRYGDLRVVAGVIGPDGSAPDVHWLASRAGAPLGATDLVRMGDVLQVDLSGADLQVVHVFDVPCNCYVATWAAP